MKGNIMMRLIALMILIPAALAHLSGQIDFTQPTWLWLTMAAGLNALQASFTGWCPATTLFGKDKITGQCCASDTTGSCCEPVGKASADTLIKKSPNECCANKEEQSACDGQKK
jgi:hypothetical protein